MKWPASTEVEEREETAPEGYHFIYVKWITRNGVGVYPPNGQKAWKIKVRDKRLTDSSAHSSIVCRSPAAKLGANRRGVRVAPAFVFRSRGS